MKKKVDWNKSDKCVRLFLGGDIMAGRAIDQMFQVHNPEKFGKPDHIPASQYRAWSEALYGGEFSPIKHDYIWGTALGIIDRANVDFRLANMEMAVTTSDDWFSKTFNFRMHPANIACISVAKLNCCTLANNHILDFGKKGLIDSMYTLSENKIGFTGAGLNQESSRQPYTHDLPNGIRVVVHSWGAKDSGIPLSWEASGSIPGLNYLADYSETSTLQLIQVINEFRQEGDITIFSIHWGKNWVLQIPDAHRKLAHRLIDDAGVDIIHGHSSHHPLRFEKYQEKLILYGCGDLINDYEGHPKYKSMRIHLGLLYFVDLDIETKRLHKLTIVPVQRRRFRLEKPSNKDSAWLFKLIKNIQ